MADISTLAVALPEITLRSAVAEPPTVLVEDSLESKIPTALLTAVVPEALRPM